MANVYWCQVGVGIFFLNRHHTIEGNEVKGRKNPWANSPLMSIVLINHGHQD